MKFNSHPELSGKHALFSPSGYSWLRYTDEKILDRIDTQMTAMHGTRLHGVGAELISLGINLPDDGTTFNTYVNDGIGFMMSPEVALFANSYIFGTADTISFRKERPTDDKFTLRIHDLKTGVTKVSMDQLCVYAAIYCIEYKVNPNDIIIELRIYQNDRVQILSSETEEGQNLRSDILTIMGRIEYIYRLLVDRQMTYVANY